jgi:guanylate kinase
MYKIIAIMGEAGTGKNSLMQEILKLKPELHEIISCTTRPMR